MSSSTSTPAELSSDARSLAGICWRLVEAQHHVSTLKLVDSVDEQELLEDLIEVTKPPVPPECRDLHYLLSTPFRYGAVYTTGSRFRRAGLTDGVFYASEKPETAVAEMAFHRLLFFAESPNTPWPINPAEYTAFSTEYATEKSIDLTKRKYKALTALWMHPSDYTHCQAFAETARAAKVEVIRYASVRDIGRGMNLALLTCRVFTKPNPLDRQTWHIRLSEAGVQAICEAPKLGITFDGKSFAADPRIAKLRWVRA
jgi:RES domain